MDNLKNSDALEVRPLLDRCPSCGDWTYEWQCIARDNSYTGNTIEAAIQQAPLLPTSDTVHLRICSENACGGTVFLVSSNHPKGGDAGHGGITTLSVQVDAMEMSLDVDDIEEDETRHFDNCSFRLTVRGDEEFYTLLNGLTAAVEALKRREEIQTIQFHRMKALGQRAVDRLPIDKEALKRVFTEEDNRNA
jgi:hypothetical protein